MPFRYDGDGQPYPAVPRPYPVPVLETAFGELDVIQQDETFGFLYFVEIAKPGQILGLMDRDIHLFMNTTHYD